MKRSCLTLLSLFFILPAIAQRNIDVLHYTFNVSLNDNNDSIHGIAEIRFVVLKNTAVISFDLAGISKGKGMMVQMASYDNTNSTGPRFTHTGNKLTFNWKHQLKKGDSSGITISYRGIPADGLIISKNKYGNRTFFADNWPNRAHNWLPCVDDPADKATVDFLVTADSHYQVIANGVQIEETNLPGNKKLTHFKEEVALPTKVMVIGVADFAINQVGDVDCVPVSSWVYPENKKAGFYDYAIAKDILAYFISYIGPYAYRKLANVQSKTRFGGMENAGAIFYAESSVTGSRLEEKLIAHEIVHQWFGNMATEKSFAHFWLSEGFATYLTHVYLESKFGYESLNRRMQEDRDNVIAFVKTNPRPVVDSTPDYMKLLNANSYQKGSWVLHMLRRQLGDTVFHKSIRKYYATYAGINADTKDLQKIFESVSGKNLDQFFKQWLFTPENPSLDITWQYDGKKKEVRMHIKQLQNHNFHFPLLISLIPKSGAPIDRKILVDKKESDFVFPVPEKPKHLVVDPHTSLLFQWKVAEQ